MDSVIKIEGISKNYNKVVALNNVSIDVNEGELFGLIGPDGSGKTTLFRILVSLLLPENGKAEMFGLNILKEYKKIRQLVGYMPGRFSLYQDLTVEENLSFFATVFGTRIENNMALIEDIWKQIEPFRKRQAGKLSGGMKQKLALCCALIHKPKVLILDEPTTGVDAVSRKEFWEMLQGLKNNQITILVSTPYMDEASLCERVALIQKGEIMKIDNPSRITDDFQHELLSISGENIYKLLNDLKSYEKANSVYLFGHDIHYTGIGERVDIKLLKEYLISRGNININIKEIKPHIEDCFMELMTK